MPGIVQSINQLLIEEGHAVAYDGGKKPIKKINPETYTTRTFIMIEIYGTDDCVFCDRAKELLQTYEERVYLY